MNVRPIVACLLLVAGTLVACAVGVELETPPPPIVVPVASSVPPTMADPDISTANDVLDITDGGFVDDDRHLRPAKWKH